MNFDSIIEYNAFVASERPQWAESMEQKYSDSYNQIASIISAQGEMAVVALFAIAQESIKDHDVVAD